MSYIPSVSDLQFASHYGRAAYVFPTWLFTIGCFIGGFLNVVVDRLPQIRHYRKLGTHPEFGLAFPASRCDNCGTPVAPMLNIPLVGWLAVRGRAACCGAKLGFRMPLVELLSGAAWLAGYFIFGITPALLAYCLTTTLSAFLTVDLRTRALQSTFEKSLARYSVDRRP